MGKFSEKHKELQKEIEREIVALIKKFGKASKHRSEKVLKVHHEHRFNLESDRFLTEISATELIDNHGYSYNFLVLPLDELCEAVDGFEQ